MGTYTLSLNPIYLPELTLSRSEGLAKHRHHRRRLDAPLPRTLGRNPHQPRPILQRHRLLLCPVRPVLPKRGLHLLHRPGDPRHHRHARLLLQRGRRRTTPGLIQVSCDNYPNGQCTDSIQDNVNTGTDYLTSQLDAAGGNAIQAFGAYNGWFRAGSGLNGNRGLTQDYPCSAEGQSNGVGGRPAADRRR